MELLIDTRMEKAAELLKTTNLKISDIASKVGYTNSSSFVRIFKKFYYISPSEYRNSSILDITEKKKYT